MKTEILFSTGDPVLDLVAMFVAAALLLVFIRIPYTIRAYRIRKKIEKIENSDCGYPSDSKKRWNEKVKRLKAIDFKSWDKDHMESSAPLRLVVFLINYKSMWEAQRLYSSALTCYQTRQVLGNT